MKKYWPLFILSPLIVLLDQWTKYWIKDHLQLGQHWTLWEGYFDIVHFRNRGAAFGMFSGWESPWRDPFFYGISALALLALATLYYKSQSHEKKTQVPLALILGGAVGNLIDRISRGEVIDFLRFHWQNQTLEFNLLGRKIELLLVWPAFNVADMAITCGAITLAVVLLFFDPKKKAEINYATFSILQS